MGESTLKTLDDVMFVQGETPVNQENWQAYFGGVLPNGIYEGFAPRTNYQGETVNGITAGVAVYNGLVYRMADGIAVDRDVPESNGYRLISLRIYPDTGVAKIVETRGNAPVSSDETILNGIIQMTQNPVVSGRDSDQNSYVDYRLCYQGHKNSLYRAGVDLRQPALMRNGKFPNGWSIYWNNYKPSTGNIILSGNMVYNWVAPRTDWSLSVWFDPMNPPDNAKVVTNAHYVTFHEYPAIVDVTRTSSPEQVDGTKDEFRNVIDCFGTNWDRQTITNPIQTYNPSVVWEYHDATPETPFVVQYRGKNGYNQSMFLIQMPTNGASSEWGLVEGTLSNQTDLQDALDAKADATTVYTKTESDTRMYSKAETDALLDAKADAADVYTKTETGEIYYTKQESDALLDEKADSADVYDKTETYTKVEADTLLDAKANASDVYAKTETYTKAEVDTALGDKANSSSVYTKSETDTLLSNKEDKSALGTFAYRNSLDYSSLSNKPTLGALASKNTVSLLNDVSGILPIANGGTGVSSINKFYDRVANFAGVRYYVSANTGNDDNSGASDAPLRTIAEAINRIGYRTEGIIDLSFGTYYETALSFDSASRYILLGHESRIFPDSFVIKRSSLHIIGSITISGFPVNVQYGGQLTTDSLSIGGVATFTKGIYVRNGSCFLDDVVVNNDGNAFYVDGGILTYHNLSGSFTSAGTAQNGGIISTGDGHIFS